MRQKYPGSWQVILVITVSNNNNLDRLHIYSSISNTLTSLHSNNKLKVARLGYNNIIIIRLFVDDLPHPRPTPPRNHLL